MARYYRTADIHPYHWDQVANAIFQRYPNPFATHVLSEDTLDRRMLSPNVLYSKRFLTKTNRLPKWGEKFLVGFKRFVPLVEESIVDTKKKIVTTYTRNVGLSRFMTAVEKVEYRINPDNPKETMAVKEVWIESGLYGLRSAVKNFGIERFKQNCQRATDGFNFVLERLQSQQNYINQVSHRKWQDLKNRGGVWRESAKHAAVVAKSHSTLLAEDENIAGESAQRE